MEPLNLITPEDIEDLSVTACSCFYIGQEDRFEILKGNIFYFIKNLDESSVGASNFYITILACMPRVWRPSLRSIRVP